MDENERQAAFGRAVEGLMGGANVRPPVVPVIGAELISDVPELTDMTDDERALITLDMAVDTMMHCFAHEVVPATARLCESIAYPPFVELVQGLCKDCGEMANVAERIKAKINLLLGE